MRRFTRFKIGLYLLLLGAFLGFLTAIFMADEKEASASGQLIIQPGSDGKDSYVFPMSPDSNFGSATALEFGGGTGGPPPFYSFLQFDLSSIPSDAIIDNANLQIYYYSYFGPQDIAVSVPLYRVTSAWDENTINWNNKPGHDGSIVDSQSIGSSSQYGWYSYNVKNLLQGWQNGSNPNYGLVLTDALPIASSGKIIYSSESGNDSLRPKLVINYSGGEAPPVAPPASQTHKVCRNLTCQSVSGAGSDTCSANSQCAAPATQAITHKACQSQKCVAISGTGVDECQSDTSCLAPPATQSTTPAEQTVGAIPVSTVNKTTPDSNADRIRKSMVKAAESRLPIVPLALAGALSVFSFIISMWSFMSAEISAKEYILALFNYILSLFSAKTRSKRGMVYDGSTGKPLAGALVNLFTFPEMRLVSSAISDIKGKFYFVAREGQFVLSATKKGFTFPSNLAKKELSYSHNIYIGQTLQIDDTEVINYRIAMDPSASYQPTRPSVLKALFLSNITRLTIMSIGTTMSLLILYFDSTRNNYFMVEAYLILWLIELLIENREVKLSHILEKDSHQPIDLALVRIIAADGKLLQTIVSDYKGRVALRADHKSDSILIERAGYRRLEKKVENKGFIEGKRFEMERVG